MLYVLETEVEHSEEFHFSLKGLRLVFVVSNTHGIFAYLDDVG